MGPQMVLETGRAQVLWDLQMQAENGSCQIAVVIGALGAVTPPPPNLEDWQSAVVGQAELLRTSFKLADLW